MGAGRARLLARGRPDPPSRDLVPVACRVGVPGKSRTSHSGGAAPDSHRLPWAPPAAPGPPSPQEARRRHQGRTAAPAHSHGNPGGAGSDQPNDAPQDRAWRPRRIDGQLLDRPLRAGSARRDLGAGRSQPRRTGAGSPGGTVTETRAVASQERRAPFGRRAVGRCRHGARDSGPRGHGGNTRPGRASMGPGSQGSRECIL